MNRFIHSERYLTAVLLAFIGSYTLLSMVDRPVPDFVESAVMVILGSAFGVPIGIKAEREQNGNGDGTK